MLAAIVPVKPLRHAKGRMAELLGPEDRARLALVMLEDVLNALRRSEVAELTAVTTADPLVARRARALGAECWPDTAGTLNGALSDAIRTAIGRGASGVLIVPGDVPLVTPQDLRDLVSQAPRTPSLVVAPTHDRGTGALLMQPAGLIAPAYGAISSARHVEAARAAGAETRLCQVRSLALDLDHPHDLVLFSTLRQRTATSEWLRRIDLKRLVPDRTGWFQALGQR
ncbi:MAG TPA: 2-phospho-L-lactate guanylyltransferase [Symbiobacteriaceae bacterium]|nr:2-phospho-L-lactate guanylyltransferase [Symbiobacteriaceae bacterium]